ncbi:MAG: HIT domain-containing protein [Deltaproteobacteria bacterium]|nr:HIT domain-containing protein [Deltaproteobacteria bacterium]
MEFLTSPTPDDVCPFCNIVSSKDDRQSLIVHRAGRAYIVLNKYPYNNGHLLIVPNTHGGDFALLPLEDWAEITSLAKFAVRLLELAYKPHGFNIGMNIGEAGGAGVKQHLHLHVVPRWTGDTNFMPVLGETKSLPQHLLASYDLIRSQLQLTENAGGG